jgi:hypothetical protein
MTPFGIENAYFCKGHEAYHLDMRKIHPECPDSDIYGPSIAVDVLLREEPQEEEEEDEGDGNESDDDVEEDEDGYSE